MCMYGCQGNRSLADRSSRVNCDVYRPMLSAQAKHTAKASQKTRAGVPQCTIYFPIFLLFVSLTPGSPLQRIQFLFPPSALDLHRGLTWSSPPPAGMFFTFCSETFYKDIDPFLCHQPAVSIQTAGAAEPFLKYEKHIHCYDYTSFYSFPPCFQTMHQLWAPFCC